MPRFEISVRMIKKKAMTNADADATPQKILNFFSFSVMSTLELCCNIPKLHIYEIFLIKRNPLLL